MIKGRNIPVRIYGREEISDPGEQSCKKVSSIQRSQFKNEHLNQY